jgi:Mrp family chromosome partitioning ATPase
MTPEQAIEQSGGISFGQNNQITIAGDVIAGDKIVTTIVNVEIPQPPLPNRPPRLVQFVGREMELAYYAEKLETAHIAVFSGMAGVGKTALATALVKRVATPEQVFWHSYG